MNILGISGHYFHDSSACLVSNGRVVGFVEEERLTRVKHNRDSQLCKNSVNYVLSEKAFSPNDLDIISLSSVDNLSELSTDNYRTLSDIVGFEIPEHTEVVAYKHHKCHAASSYYASGFTSSNIIVIDGSGDGVSTSLYFADDSGLQLIDSYDYTQSVGWFYEYITEHCGLGDWSNTGKLMGLSSYGTPTYKFSDIDVMHDKYAVNLPIVHRSPMDYYQRMKSLRCEILSEAGYPPIDNFNDIRAKSIFNHYANLASSAQEVFERVLLMLAHRIYSVTGERNFCLAGGGALNCVANSKLYKSDFVKKLFIQPASNDSGCSLGSAYLAANTMGEYRKDLFCVYSGTTYSNDNIALLLSQKNLFSIKLKDTETIAARLLHSNKTIAWFQGGMEVGPRALGNRSILANPRISKNLELVNEIKNREFWRPLSPSILHEHASVYLKNWELVNEYMTVTGTATELAVQRIPATVHVDGSMRAQIVSPTSNNRFYSLIQNFYKISGVPAVLNTSFNLNGLPIVSSPEDALSTFENSSIDFLVINDFLVSKEPIKEYGANEIEYN